MPLPLIPIIIGISALLGIGVKVYWDTILIYLKGKNITILGDIQTGKTTLHKFLRNGEIVSEHIGTKRKIKVKKNKFELGELELLIKEGTDISGLREYISDWKDIFKNTDICFYLFDVSKVYSGDKEYIEKIYFHLTHIDNWTKEFKINPRFVLIGTFADLIPEYNQLNKSNAQLFEQKILEKIKHAYWQASISPSDIFIGSLKNKETIELLIKEILIRLPSK